MPRHGRKGRGLLIDNSHSITPPTKTLTETHHLPVEIAFMVLKYIPVDENYAKTMLNLARVEKSWISSAISLLYKHVVLSSYEAMLAYRLQVVSDPKVGMAAHSIILNARCGPPNPESVICDIVEACCNVESFFVTSQCPPTWVNGPILMSMSSHMRGIKKLAFRFCSHVFGRALAQAVETWPDLTHLELTDVLGVDEHQYTEILLRLRNLKILRLSRIVLDHGFRDRIADCCLRTIAKHNNNLKILELNNCTRLTNVEILSCFPHLSDSLECLILTGCKQISGITLANVIVHCNNLRSLDVSRSSFNNEAVNLVAGHRAKPATDTEPAVAEVSPRLPMRITKFAMSRCDMVVLHSFAKLADVFLTRIKQGLVDCVTIYVHKNEPNLHPNNLKSIEKLDKPLRRLQINHKRERFNIEDIIKVVG